MGQNGDQIIQCRGCGAKNRIPIDRIASIRSAGEAVKCGKCHEPLAIDSLPEAYTLRCSNCEAKNRIPAGRINSGGKCGKCSEPLQIDQLFLPQPVMITDANLEDKVLQSPLPVLLYAWATW